MTVIQLIQELRLCNDNDIVMFDMKQSLENQQYCTDGVETTMPVDEVLVGKGTNRGFVYLSEEVML